MTMPDLRKLIDRYAPAQFSGETELARLCRALEAADRRVRELGKRLDELRSPKDTRRFAP